MALHKPVAYVRIGSHECLDDIRRLRAKEKYCFVDRIGERAAEDELAAFGARPREPEMLLAVLRAPLDVVGNQFVNQKKVLHAVMVTRGVLGRWKGWPLVVLAVLSVVLVPKTPLRVLGPLTVALLIGMAIGSPIARTVPRDVLVWLSREVLRVAVVLSAVRLDWVLLARAGPGPLVIAVLAVALGLTTFAILLRTMRVPPRLGALIAIGTSVCGAAAITAARPVVDATDEESHVGIAIISVLGAAASLALVLAQGVGWIPTGMYGLVSGGSLHEVAHVMAAATANPDTLDIAMVTKLARVALLPVGLLVLPAMVHTEGKRVPFRVPPLVIWFLLMSVVATVAGHASPSFTTTWKQIAKWIAMFANVMLATSMLAIGSLVEWGMIRRAGRRTLVMAVIGALILGAAVIGASALLQR
jgi:uncharacterized integral membrane protein (TIGR00698 family)